MRKTAKEIYPELTSSYRGGASIYGPSDYTPLLESFGEILVRADLDDYQGDSFALLLDFDETKEPRYGVLHFGWGSCSGCDSLQACESYAEIEELQESLLGSIKWFTSIADMKKYYLNKDHQGEWYYNETVFQDFRQQIEEMR